MQKIIYCILLLSMLYNPAFAQQDIFVGTFNNAQYTISLQMKSVPGGYHGVVKSTDGLFAVSAQKTGQQLKGVIYTQAGNIDFKAIPQNGVLAISAMGKTEAYYKSSSNHQLASIDLSTYMTNTAEIPAGTNNPNASGETQLFQLIAGSQLAIYNRTSILNDSNASSLTYINFCANGRFSINFDGSFSVEGNYGSNAQGASRGKYSGNWKLLQSANGPQVQLQYSNGQNTNYPVYKNYLLQGSWRVGNTQYAIQRNKAICY